MRGALLLLLLAGPALADEPPSTSSSTSSPSSSPTPANLELIYHGEAAGILGRGVYDPTDARIGTIADVLVDEGGQPRAAVIDFGGFMGVGQRRIAIAWRALHFLPAAQNRHVRVELTADQVKAIPEYKPTVTNPPPVAATEAAPPK